MSYYWPIADGQAKELINSRDLFDPVNVTFVPDRFGNLNSAFQLNSGYFKAPADSYFGESFTIMAWVKLNNYIRFQRLLDFGNGPDSDNMVCFEN